VIRSSGKRADRSLVDTWLSVTGQARSKQLDGHPVLSPPSLWRDLGRLLRHVVTVVYPGLVGCTHVSVSRQGLFDSHPSVGGSTRPEAMKPASGASAQLLSLRVVFMTVASQSSNRYLDRPTPSSLADVIDTILDKGLVIDIYVRVSLVGIELLTIDARIVIASVDTYLRFAEAVNRLDLTETSDSLTDLISE
jgi:hypothetical protein